MKPRLDIFFSLSQQWRFLFGKAYIPEKGEFLLNHARSGILLALRALYLPAGSKVGVMAYNCHTVMNAVEQAGFSPVFLDVTEDMRLDLDDFLRKADSLSAVVVSHLFGIVNDVKRIREEFPDLVIIEDCAHAFGLNDLEGDFAVFSIGQGKFPSIGDGGILKVLNEEYEERVKALYETIPNYSWAQNVTLFMRLWINSIAYSRWLYGWLTYPLKKNRGVPSGRDSIVLERMSRSISAIYAKEKNAVSEMIERRKVVAQSIKESLPQGIKQTMIGDNAFMLVLSCCNPQSVKEAFLKRGIETDTHFAHSILWAKEFGYVLGQCPNVENLVDHLLMVPLYPKR